VKYCCEYAYWCPTSGRAKCYAHDGLDVCCEREDLHECLSDMHGGDDGLMFGDGFMCLRCGNYEAAGNPHLPAQPGYPKKIGPARRGSWLDDPPADNTSPI